MNKITVNKSIFVILFQSHSVNEKHRNSSLVLSYYIHSKLLSKIFKSQKKRIISRITCFRSQYYAVHRERNYHNLLFFFRNNHKSGQSIKATPVSVSPLAINSGTTCAVIVHGYGGKGTDSMSLVLRDGI